MSEIVFMLLVPFFFRRLGVKWMILVAMGAWVLRYLLFALGAPEQVVWMLFLGIALHGICYDFFFVTGFMYTDRVASPQIRGQAQSLLVFFTQGVGMFIGYQVAARLLGPVSGPNGELTTAITAARGDEAPSFAQQLGQMFSVEMPAGVDPGLLSKVAELWKTYWLLPAGMAAVILVLFLVSFRDSGECGDAGPERN
jgi:MFS family permease